MQHTLVTLMQNRPGVLHRAISLFRRRGFNIESLAVGGCESPGVSRMTLVVDAADVEQVVKQLYRLVEVIKVADITHEPAMERETALLKVNAPAAARASIVAVAASIEAKIIDVDVGTMVLELTATPAKVEKLIELVRPFGMKELIRSGRIAMTRGPRTARTMGVTNGRRAAGDDAAPAGATTPGEPSAAEEIPLPHTWLAQADGIA